MVLFKNIITSISMIGILAISSTSSAFFSFSDSLNSTEDTSSISFTDEENKINSFLGTDGGANAITLEEKNQTLEMQLQQMEIEKASLKKQLSQAQLGKTVYNEDIKYAEKPAVICRDFNCSRVNSKTTSEFLYSSLFKMFYYNKHSKVSICEADPANRSCIYSGIKIGADLGAGTPVVLDIASMTIYDLDFDKGFQSLEYVFQPDILANGIKSKCSAYKNRIEVRGSNSIVAVGGNFYCNLASSSNTVGSSLFNIDYIDMDYNLIGGYYSFNFDGGGKAGKTGYMLLKFPEANNAVLRDANKMARGADNTSGDGEYVAPGQYKIIPVSNSEEVKIEKKSTFSSSLKDRTRMMKGSITRSSSFSK